MRGRDSRTGSRTAFRLVLCAGLVPGPLVAQRPLEVRAVRDLDFGDLLPGVPSSVSRLDPGAGEFEIRGEPGAAVTVTFHLPDALGAGSGAVRLGFGAADASYSAPGASGALVFDPRRPVTVRLDARGRGFLRLGASALPAPGEGGGVEVAPIGVAVDYAGG